MFWPISTRKLRTLFLAVIAVNVLIISTLTLVGSLSNSAREFTVKETTEVKKPLPKYTSAMAQGKPGFDKKVDTEFEKFRVEKKIDWLFNTTLGQVDLQIPLTRFLKNKDHRVFETDDSWLNKNEIFYDPRFTLSIYLSELTRQYMEKASGVERPPQGISLSSLGSVKLPFNWVDWMDLTSLNDELKKTDDKLTCDKIQNATTDSPDTSYFCRDNKDITKEQVQKLGFRNKEQLPGVTIFDHSKHEHRSPNDIRLYQGKNYAYTQNLPKPVQVVILSAEGGSIEFEVDNESNERIIYSNLVHNYLSFHGIPLDRIGADYQIEMNHVDAFNKLKTKFRFTTPLSESNDPRGLREVLSSSGTKELRLAKEVFSYPESRIQEQIVAFEKRGVGSLSRIEKMYYESLKESDLFVTPEESEYFKMAVIEINDSKNEGNDWGWGYDWRFFNGALMYKKDGWSQKQKEFKKAIVMDRLIRNWSRFTQTKGLVSWIMHGPLLSWYWNGQLFPYESQLKVQMPVADILRLAQEFNQTLVVEDPSEGYGRYLLDVNTYIHHRDINKEIDQVDARFIDVDTGMFISVNGLAKSRSNLPSAYKSGNVPLQKDDNDAEAEVYNDRRKDFYSLEQLSPLRYSMVAGTPVFVPYNIKSRLAFEFGSGVKKYESNGYYFSPVLNMWLKEDTVKKIYSGDDVKVDGKIDRRKLLDRVYAMSENDARRLLRSDNDLMIEFHMTKKSTRYHQLEKAFLFTNLGTDNVELRKNRAMRAAYEEVVSTVKFGPPVHKCLFDYEHHDRAKHT